jgi:hypothetical protein
VFFHPVSSAGHLVHSSPSGPRNIDALYFILGWDWDGFDKMRAGTRYAELVFLNPVGSAGHVMHSVASETPNVNTLFSCSSGTESNSTQSAPEHIKPNLCFCTGGICGSHSAFR